MAITHDRMRSANWRRVLGVAFLSIPIGVLLLLGIGEIAGGDVSGLQHAVELVPLISLAILARKRPRIGGAILIALAALLIALYPFVMAGRFPPWVLLINDVMLFGPAIASGLLLITARKDIPRNAPTDGVEGNGIGHSG